MGPGPAARGPQAPGQAAAPRRRAPPRPSSTSPAGSPRPESSRCPRDPESGRPSKRRAADLESLNLARVIADGEHIVVPAQGAAPAPAGAGAPEGAKCVNLNAASEQELQELDGVGPAMASRIAQYRAAHGTITSVDELDDVPGIGPALLEKIRSGACP